MKTEEQAKQCWCPERAKEAAIVIAAKYSHSRQPPSDEMYSEMSRCIASACNLWISSGPMQERLRIYEDSAEQEQYERRSGGDATFKDEPWLYEYTTVDERGKFDQIFRQRNDMSHMGRCGLVKP